MAHQIVDIWVDVMYKFTVPPRVKHFCQVKLSIDHKTAHHQGWKYNTGVEDVELSAATVFYHWKLIV